MPRPLKARRDLRQRFDLYLDEREVDQIRTSAEAARLPMSVFLRRIALRQRITAPTSDHNLEQWRALGRLANNLNQIARACNAGLVPEEISAVVCELAEHVRLLRLTVVGVKPEAL